jgi:hypothetical protein
LPSRENNGFERCVAHLKWGIVFLLADHFQKHFHERFHLAGNGQTVSETLAHLRGKVCLLEHDFGESLQLRNRRA